MKTFFLLLAVTFVGCSEIPCSCCVNCGVECRNRCEGNRCLLANPCCDKCRCYKKKPVKVEGLN